MAKGDVVSDLQDIAAAGNLDYQPAAGVETLITEFSSETGVGNIKLFDGTTNNSSVVLSAIPFANTQEHTYKILVNNSIYLRMTNTASTNEQYGFCGIQTK